ncbi:MAG: BrxA/BrxB family bacilliredoxin [Bacteroidia bacterium]|nr:BrxA/BrxB family bacilliredoxin [Bacteroidia bacterium]MCZ2276505.1 BrxA/BrxB family bacilliredoxin [Bacteroidia bacterium]
MPYPEQLCAPMRAELVEAGFTELHNKQDVESALRDKKGTALLVFNSVCGCAAGVARPAIKLSLNKGGKKPDHLLTVFAGQDLEATQAARQFTMPYPPSSPSFALFKDGKLVHFVERHNIEGFSADMIADNLSAAYKEFC